MINQTKPQIGIGIPPQIVQPNQMIYNMTKEKLLSSLQVSMPDNKPTYNIV